MSTEQFTNYHLYWWGTVVVYEHNGIKIGRLDTQERKQNIGKVCVGGGGVQ